MPAGQSGARLPMRRGACLVLGLAVMVVVCIFFPTSQTHAAKRLALVIGNNAYENVPALQKAVNDSEAISQELVKLGFAVVSAENVGRRAMSRGLVELESKIESGGHRAHLFRRTRLCRRRYQLPSAGRFAGGESWRGGSGARCVLCRQRPLRPAAGKRRSDRKPHPRCLPRQSLRASRQA